MWCSISHTVEVWGMGHQEHWCYDPLVRLVGRLVDSQAGKWNECTRWNQNTAFSVGCDAQTETFQQVHLYDSAASSSHGYIALSYIEFQWSRHCSWGYLEMLHCPLVYMLTWHGSPCLHGSSIFWKCGTQVRISHIGRVLASGPPVVLVYALLATWC